MNESGGIAANVAAAISAAMDWRSSAEAKRNALSYLESVRFSFYLFLMHLFVSSDFVTIQIPLTIQ